MTLGSATTALLWSRIHEAHSSTGQVLVAGMVLQDAATWLVMTVALAAGGSVALLTAMFRVLRQRAVNNSR